MLSVLGINYLCQTELPAHDLYYIHSSYNYYCIATPSDVVMLTVFHPLSCSGALPGVIVY